MYQTVKNIEIYEYLLQVMKTSELVKMLAEVEIKNCTRFTADQLIRATMQTNTNTITRRDIEIIKVILTDKEYQYLQKAILNMCNAYVTCKSEGGKRAIKELVKLKDDCYERIVNRLN